MSTFKQLINQIASDYNLIIEQGPTPQLNQSQEQNVDNATQQINNDQPIVDNSVITPPENSALPSQGDMDNNNIEDSKELLYIRLIFKALITELDPSQYTDLINIKEINNKNAKSVLNKLESIINSNTTID